MTLTKPIIFLHTPRTGGSTFNSILEKIAFQNSLQYFRAGIAGYNEKFAFKYFEPNKTNNLYSAHFVFSEECKQTDLITLVRDPVKMFISNIYAHFGTYTKTNLNNHNKKIIETKINLNLNQTLSDVVQINKLFEYNFLVSNTLTKTFAGIPYDKFFYTANDYKLTQNDYNTAKKNLQYFKLIGDTDFFDLFVKKLILTYLFKLDNYQLLNSMKYNSKNIAEIIEKLHKECFYYNYFDILLMKEIKKNNNYII